MRIAFLIDGFNLYHSAVQASIDLKNSSTKWLDISSLCSSYMYLLGREAHLQSIYYFSALAIHLEARKPDVTKRHMSFITCLESTGIVVELGRFKEKTVHCHNCNRTMIRHEEKETDVAISVKLLELMITDECDTTVIITGDTDIAPAVRTAQKLFPKKSILFAFPYGRKNRELVKIAPKSFSISKEQYTKHQFSDPFILADGTQIHKPVKW